MGFVGEDESGEIYGKKGVITSGFQGMAAFLVNNTTAVFFVLSRK